MEHIKKDRKTWYDQADQEKPAKWNEFESRETRSQDRTGSSMIR